MVRNIAAGLAQIGTGTRCADWLTELLELRNRQPLGPTAPARGLYLVDVRYPAYRFPPGVAPGLLRAIGTLERL
jgi:tRNA pseudouridine38-40 synthase